MDTRKITGYAFLIASFWVGYSYGTHKQVSDTSLAQSSVLSNISIKLKAIKLLDNREHIRARKVLILTTEANFNYLENLNIISKSVSWWQKFVPASNEYKNRLASVVEKNNVEKKILIQEFQLLKNILNPTK